MLTENSYHVAVFTYVGSAAVLLAYLAWWLGRHWRPGFVALVVLLLAALLLTPAYPKAGVTTMAPALIVAAFQIFTQGLDAAQHALRPLVVAAGLAIVLSLLLSVVLFRLKRPRKPLKAKSRARA